MATTGAALERPKSAYSHRMLKDSVQVVPPELEDGNTEYKRQVYQPTSSRVRSLATQMSYRLDEGKGYCTYNIGVEDDGRHSLLTYDSVAESARVLECIGRSLNAIVIERKIIQNDVVLNDDRIRINSMEEDTEGTNESNNENFGPVSIIIEEPIFGKLRSNVNQLHEDEKEEKTEEVSTATAIAPTSPRIQKQLFTRCELMLQRIETHLLDPSPIPLMELITNTGSTVKNVKPNNDQSTSSGKKITKSDTTSNAATTKQSKMEEKQQEPTDTTSNAKTPQTASVTETMSARNIRVAVVGNVDAGKSTLIGTLTTSSLDDGRGRSRTSIMKHRHEIETGRTSTATTHLMGFRHTGEPIAGRDSIRANKRKSEDEIARESYRIVTLMDLAGHEKYLKTTIHGVSSGFADYSLILVNARHPPTHMTQHHLNLCCSFGIPLIVIFTKTDSCPEHAMKNSKEELNKLLRAPDVGRKPFVIKSEKDITTCMGKLHSLAPIIDTSCVTGAGLGLLRKLLFALPKRRKHENKINRSFEFLVEDVFNVPGVGGVVSGFVNGGKLSVGPNSQVFVGPTDDGKFIKTVAKSAHIARINTTDVTSGQSACLALALKKEERLMLRRGMVVMQETPTSTKEFDAEICVLKGEGTTIRRSYQAYVHILNVRQSAFAKDIEIVNTNAIGHHPHNDEEEGIVLRPGSRAKVRFEFAKRPEYVRAGMRMLFRDGRVRGVGIITGIPALQPIK